ncbi:helix-turn-helix domain-containing protein [Streptomyces sp. NBC_01351]|nr:helix-turn-helix domain-containing protein [Streptomyces sp. NBC_01351]
MSSGGVPARERFEWFSDLISREVMPSVLSSERPADFQAEAAALDLGELRLARFAFSPLRSRRTAAMIRRGDPEQYQLALMRQGVTSLSQHRNECTAGTNDFLVWDTSRPQEAELTGGGPVQVVVLQIPRDVLPLRSQRLDQLLARRIQGGRGMAAILASFLTALEDHGPQCTPEELRHLGTVALDLAAACLAQHLDSEEHLPAEVRAQALLQRIYGFIEHNLGDPELTPSTIAARHNISVRSLHQLFKGHEESVHVRIRRRRLEQCRSDLGRPDLGAHPVHTIAARWGFSGPVVFSRSFREAYGISPTEFRALSVKGSRADGSAL